jgi:hypothetical protein
MQRNFSISIKLAGALYIVAAGSTAQAAGVSGAIFTTTATGSVVNANLYDSKCAVYLDGGPGPNAPTKAAGLPDGDYYFQVTDPSGAKLLSTDPVSSRSFRVSGGIITNFTGTGHPTGIDQDHSSQGAITIRLANSTCPSDFLDTPNTGNVYKVWATPIGSFIGNAANVDNACGNGCFHGFVPSQSKTDNFKVQTAAAATFCLTLQKQQLNTDGTLSLLPLWIFQVTDPLPVTNQHTTGTNGQVTVCQLVTGTYTVVEDLTDVNQPDPFNPNRLGGCSVVANASVNNANPVQSMSVTFTWNSTQPVTVSFVNALQCPAILPQ